MADELKNDVERTSHFTDQGQLRIIDLKGAVPYGETALPLTPEEVAFEDQRRSDLSILKEANTNRETSEAFIATRGLIGRWNTAELMLRAWVDPIKWKGSDQLRSHLGIPLVAEQFYSIHSVVNQTLFGGYRVFMVDPTSGTPIACAEAQEAILKAELKTCGYKGVSAKSEMREITFDGLIYGFGIAHYGWETIKKNIIKKVQKAHPQTVNINGNAVNIPSEEIDDVEEVVSVSEINMPKFEHVPLRRARWATDLRRGDARVSEWFGRLIYKNGYSLDSMRGQPGWNIPTRAQLVAITTPQMQADAGNNPMETLGSNTGNPIFQQSTTPQKADPANQTDRIADPLMRNFELFDYWTPYRHAIILNKEYVLLNETHEGGKVPFLSFCFRSAPDSAHGYGIAFWLTDFQRIAQGIVNAYMDDLNLNLMGTYTAPAGTNNSAQAQWVFPGKIFKNDSATGGELKAITRNSIDAKEPLAVIAQIKAWAASITGAGPGTLGSNPGAAGDLRTPGGVEAITGGETVKLQDLIDVISEQVMTPFLEFCIEHNQKLKPSQVKAMLSQTLGTAFAATPLDILNGSYAVELSAGPKLVAREALNKYLTYISTILQAPGTVENLTVQAMKVDYNAFISAMFDSSGMPYKENIIVPMDDDDKARMAANTQAAVAQTKLGIVHAQGEVKKDVDNNQSENRMLIETGKHALKEHGKDTDQVNDMALQKQQQQFAQTPEAQGLDRAAKGAFANQDKAAFE